MDASGQDAGTGQAAKAEDLRTTVNMVAKSDRPYQLGDVEIDDEGRLRPRQDGAPIIFGFSYRGLDFMAEIETGGTPRLSLNAELGKLPYRFEAGQRRDSTRRILEATQALPRGAIVLSDSQDMRLSAEIVPPAPLTPANIMAALTAILLDFKPYLDLLHDVLIVPPEPVSESTAS